MASTIDERVVEMTFKGDTFAQGVKTTVSALADLKSKLSGLGSSTSEFNNLDTASKKLSLGGIASGVENLGSKFTAMGLVGVSVLANIANKAVDAGLSLVKSLTITPITAGFQSYETKINAIQTILANTASEGTKLPAVTAALTELNKYANLTVYNFADMTRNIGTFTAAGVNLKTSVASIKGIANLAALSGSSADQASTAMYQLSQAIAAGRVKLQDWNSVVNAGLGGKVFQNAILKTAAVNGVAVDAMLKKYGGFRNSLQSGFLTSKILTQTLSEFTGDLSDKQLRAMGFTAAETDAIQKQAKIALQSATQIRTVSQLIAALKDDISTAYASVFEAIIGNITQAPKVLTAVFNTLSGAITKPIYELSGLLDTFDKLGGREDIIKAISNAFHDLQAILKPIGEAFEAVFPPVAATTLLSMAQALEKFTADMHISSAGSEDLRKTFQGLFSAVKIVFDIVGDAAGVLGKMFGAIDGGSSTFLGLTANIGNFLTKLEGTVSSSAALKKFFSDFGTVATLPVKALTLVINALEHFGGILGKVVDSVKPFVSEIGTEFGKIGSAIVKGIQGGGVSNIAHLIDQILLGGVLVSIRKFISGLGSGDSAGKTGLFDTIKESFEGLTSTLKTMQTTLKSETLEKIAIAVALLTASIVALSFISIKNLTKSLSAISIMFTELLLSMSVVAKIAGSAGILKMAAVGLALNLLATAILILSGAVAILSKFSWAQLERGIGAIAALLTLLTVAALIMGSNSKSLVASAYSMEIMAVAINILAEAVKKLSEIPFAELAKGVGAIAALLVIIGLFNRFGGGKNLITTAAAMVILGAALIIIAKAVTILGSLSVGELAKGLIGVAAALLIIAGAMIIMPPDMALTAVSLLLVAEALVILSKALVAMGALSWNAVAKSLVLLAGSLVIIAVAMILMTTALPGAAALVIVAAALSLLTPVLVAFSQLSWSGIAKALLTLAGVFVIIAAAGILLTPLIPTLLGLGLAITLLGVGILAAGAGVALFAVGLTALAIAVTASGAAILSFVTSIIGLIPATLKQIGLGIDQFAVVIGKSGPKLAKAFQAVLTALLTAISKVVPLAAKAVVTILNTVISTLNKETPKVVNAIGNLTLRLLQGVEKYEPKFLTAGINIIVNLLNGIAKNVGRMTAAATHIVIAFITAIGTSSLAITQAGANMIITFINGLATEIRADTPRVRAAGINLAGAIVDGMTLGLADGIPGIVKGAINMVSSAYDAAKNWIESKSPSKKFQRLSQTIGDGVVVGLDDRNTAVKTGATRMAQTALDAMRTGLAQVGGLVDDNINASPRITPIIDLTEAKKGFNTLSALSKSNLIGATTSTLTATSISAGNSAAATAAGLVLTGGSKSLTYNQYNTSPVALSAADIYRQTKNQLSVTRRGLP